MHTTFRLNSGGPNGQPLGDNRVNCWEPSGFEKSKRGNQQPSLKYTWGRFRDYLRNIVSLITGSSARQIAQQSDDIVHSLRMVNLGVKCRSSCFQIDDSRFASTNYRLSF